MRKNSNDSSRILLVCLGLNVNHNKINSVNTAFIYKLFSEFGSVQKILIFTKKDILKSFVEFKSFESSERAKKALHNKVIGDMGKARLYASGSFAPASPTSTSRAVVDSVADNNSDD